MLTSLEATLGPDHDRVAHILAHLARAHILQGNFAIAGQQLDRAVEILDRTQGPSFPELSRPLIAQGLLALARGRPAEALAPLERTLALVGDGWEPPAEYTELRLALAEALWSAGGDRVRARALVGEVVERLRDEAASPGRAGWIADAERWLAGHPEA
ncbi:tetratricopeptide repeat protein [Nannocystis sp.]|uniref:tetratricopeptide repeat protein n=1 Tax=Nannocystis sp. TaxID=1962667 RepID=UPI0025DD603A|nr:tetratricopeptide repeat protein [Nannocystis sp.]MBK7827225.1 tetratricopeptide repeat protein [Nannocystis sp.]